MLANVDLRPTRSERSELRRHPRTSNAPINSADPSPTAAVRAEFD
jgi:hypothetical protein